MCLEKRDDHFIVYRSKGPAFYTKRCVVAETGKLGHKGLKRLEKACSMTTISSTVLIWLWFYRDVVVGWPEVQKVIRSVIQVGNWAVVITGRIVLLVTCLDIRQNDRQGDG